MFSVLQRMLKSEIKQGSLTVTDADGEKHIFGDGTGKHVHVHLTDPTLYW